MKFIHVLIITIFLLPPSTALAERKSPVDGGVLTSSPGLRLEMFSF